MYILDLVLFLSILSAIICVAVIKVLNKDSKYIKIGYFMPIVVSVIHFVLCKFNYLSVPIYIASIVILLMYFVRKKKIIYGLLCILTIIFLLMPLASRTLVKAENYASESYVDAFKDLNRTLKDKYPFTEWKEIDFDKKYEEYIDRFRSADKNNDKEEYYIALKDYLLSFNDGHISALKPLQLLGINDEFVSNLKEKYIGYGYGFSLIKLDNGNVVVSVIDEDSEAFKAGISVGTIITKWNDKPIAEVANEVSKTWALERSADKSNMEQNNCMMVPRTGEGESANITFINSSNEEQSIYLKAKEGNYDIGTKDRDIFYHNENINSKDIEYKYLNGGHGYIKISTMKPENEDEVIEMLKTALIEFNTNNVEDLIIDVRNNGGGKDEFAAKITGLFSKEEMFYLQEKIYDSENNSFIKQREIVCKPNYVGFDKPIVILANSCSMSATEGFVYNMKKLNNVISAGITGTSGSFGSITDEVILMPENYAVLYPNVACMNESGEIIIDADSTRVGGVNPDLKIPLDMNAIEELYVKSNDYELDYIVNYLK